VTIEKSVFVWNFPKILFVFFKRFEWGYNPRKIKGEVAIPNDTINISPYYVNQDGKKKISKSKKIKNPYRKIFEIKKSQKSLIEIFKSPKFPNLPF